MSERPKFTREHYNQIAHTIANMPDVDVREYVALKFANMLAADNPNFAPGIFRVACNLDTVITTDLCLEEHQTPVEAVICGMSEPKRTYARRTWMIWTGKKNFSEIPEVPINISERAKEDVRVELAHFDTKTGEKI